jgi:hypothetical protein
MARIDLAILPKAPYESKQIRRHWIEQTTRSPFAPEEFARGSRYHQAHLRRGIGNRELNHDTPCGAGFFKVRLRHGPALSTERAALPHLRRLAGGRAHNFYLIVSRRSQFHTALCRFIFSSHNSRKTRSPPLQWNEGSLRTKTRADEKMTRK